jgi:hypothetical protein
LLDAPLPQTHVNTPICPLHTAEAVSFVFVIGTGINVTRLPLKNTLAVFFIEVVLSFVRVTSCTFLICKLLTLPLSMTMLKTVKKLARETGPIFPFVLTKSLRLAMNILTNVNITI